MTPSALVRQEGITLPRSLPRSYRAWLQGEFPEELAASGEAISDFHGGDQSRAYLRFLECRTRAWFMRNIDTGKVIVQSNACRVRGCPLCARSQGMQIAHNLAAWLRKIRNPKHIILTLLHSDQPLSEIIDHLLESFRKMRRYKRWLRTVSGGVWFAQVTRNQTTSQWHVHLHVLADAGFYPQSLLSRDWHCATADSYNTFIRAITDTFQAVRDASRYVARPGWLHLLTRPLRLQLLGAFAGRHLCGAFGTARSAHILKREHLDPKRWESLGDFQDVRDLIYTDPDAAAIYMAWLTGNVLEPGVTVQDISDVAKFRINFHTRDPPQPKQRVLWEAGAA